MRDYFGTFLQTLQGNQSPPSEHDQLGWLMGEVDRLEAELEQARKERASMNVALDATVRRAESAEAELKQEREDAQTCPHSNCDAQRWREALEQLAPLDNDIGQIARDALAGKGQT